MTISQRMRSAADDFALRFAPGTVLLNGGRLRRTLGLAVGRKRYEALKQRLLRTGEDVQ